MKKQWIIVAVIIGLLGSGAWFGVRMAPDIFPVEVGARAPDFGSVDLATGDSVRFASEYRGQVVLLNIWATWCAPCREEMPSIERLHQALGPTGLKILAVSIDEGGADVVRDFQRELGFTFRVSQDRSRSIERIYQTTGVPETFVLDRQGRIVKKVIGAYDWDAPIARDLFRRLLAEPN